MTTITDKDFEKALEVIRESGYHLISHHRSSYGTLYFDVLYVGWDETAREIFLGSLDKTGLSATEIDEYSESFLEKYGAESLKIRVADHERPLSSIINHRSPHYTIRLDETEEWPLKLEKWLNN